MDFRMVLHEVARAIGPEGFLGLQSTFPILGEPRIEFRWAG
jgi:hypothetical protein